MKTSFKIIQSTVEIFLQQLCAFLFGEKADKTKKRLSVLLLWTMVLLSASAVFLLSFQLTGNSKTNFVRSSDDYERISVVTLFIGYILFAFSQNLIFFSAYRKAVKQAKRKSSGIYRITITRMTALYFGDFLLGIWFLLPSLTGYALHIPFTAEYLLFCLFSLFVLPFFMSALSGLTISLLTILCVRLRTLPKIVTVLGGLFLMAEFIVTGFLMNHTVFLGSLPRIRPFSFYADSFYTAVYQNEIFVRWETDFYALLYFFLISLTMVLTAVFIMMISDGIAQMTKRDFHTVMQILKVSLQAMITSTLSFISGKSNLKKLRHSTFGTVITIVMIFFVLALLSFFFGLFAVIAFAAGSHADIYFFAVFAGATIFALMGSIFAAQSYLFEAKDNELLLSMPLSPTVILLSRVFTLYSLNFIYSMIVMLPSFLAYVTFVKISFSGIIFYLLSLFALPIFITALGSVIGYLLWKIASKMPKKNAFSNLFGILMLSGIAGVWLFIDRTSMTLSEFAEWIQWLTYNYLFPIHWYALAIAEGSLLYMLLFLLFCCVVLVPVMLFIAKRFIGIITAKENVKGKAYIRKPLKQHSVFVALLKKEIVYFFKLPGYVLNSGMGSIMMIIMGIFLLCKGIDFPEEVYGYLPNFDNVVKISVVSAVSLMAVMNDVSAPSISLEGKTLWILRSTPVDCMTIFLSKALVAPIITLPGIIFMTVVSAVKFPLSLTDILFVFCVPTLASFFSGILGVLINLRFPRFDWSAEIIVIKQSGSVLLTILGSIFITGLPFIFAIILPALIPDFGIWISYMICAVYLVVVTTVCFLLLKYKGRALYENL